MPNNYLLVVEGANDEKNILQSVFEKYGFNVIKCEEKISAESYCTLQLGSFLFF